MSITLWIDADALPTVCRQLIIKTALRENIHAHFVANRPIALPSSPLLHSIIVGAGFDVADNWIADNAKIGDVIITNDIPLANDVLAVGALALDNRGNAFDSESIAQKLAVRNFMDTMRHTGVFDPTKASNQKPYSDLDKKRFADTLNRLITKAKKQVKLTSIPPKNDP